MMSKNIILILTIVVFINKIYGQTKIDLLPGFECSSPTISIDGNMMCFTSNQKGISKIYEVCKNDSGKWLIPKEIEDINNFSELAKIKDPFLSYDGKRLYYSANFSNSLGGMDIYYSEHKNGKWSTPVNIGRPINSAKDETSPSVSINNKYLYFTRKNENSNIDMNDCGIIYMSGKRNGKWSSPDALPSIINQGCETSSKINFDNRSLIFASVRGEGEKGFDLYYTKILAKGFFGEPQNIGFLNSANQEYAASLSSSGKTIYFTEGTEKKQNIINNGIYKIKVPDKFIFFKQIKIIGKITDLKNIPITADIIVTNVNTSDTVINKNNDGKNGKYILYLSESNNYKIEVFKKGFSYYSFFVNSKDEKINEVVKKDIKLYSNVNLILNVFDAEIFEPLECKITIMDKDSTIIKSKINNPDKGRYNIDFSIGKKYFITVQRKNYLTNYINLDFSSIVQYPEFERDIELHPVKKIVEINVVNDSTNIGLDAEIVITNLDKKETIIKKVSKNKDGKYVVELREGDKYEINVNGPKGFSFYNKKVDMSSDKNTKKLDVRLKPLTAKTKIELNNITFETNSADLNLSSDKELERVVKFLTDNPKIKIEIQAHTDDVGSKKYNQKLSDKRALSVVNYLIDKSIVKDRLIAKGYGETMPLVSNDNEENRAKNRRVELKIVDIKSH